jgi:antitoxin CptB
MNVNEEMKRLRWSCRRGMWELDILLQGFLEQHFAKLSAAEQQTFQRLLACNDQQLYRWFIDTEQPQEIDLLHLVEKIRESTKAKL